MGSVPLVCKRFPAGRLVCANSMPFTADNVETPPVLRLPLQYRCRTCWTLLTRSAVATTGELVHEQAIYLFLTTVLLVDWFLQPPRPGLPRFGRTTVEHLNVAPISIPNGELWPGLLPPPFVR